MEIPRKPSLKVFGIVTALMVLVAVLLACGPADEQVQRTWAI